MKKIKLTSFLLLIGSISFAQQWTGASGLTGDLYRTGDVGIGTSTVPAPLTVYQAAGLGLPLNSNSIIKQLGGLTGASGGNKFYNSLWLRRVTANDPSWYSTVLHDGISIDGNYNTPGTNTRIWWERNPSAATESWGDVANTWMTLKGPNGYLIVGSPATGNTSISLSVSAQSNGYGVLECVSAQGTNYGNIVINPTGGNVLIGKASENAGANYLLDVDGTERCNKLVVNTTGADFVFQKNYKLLSLDSLENYVTKNQRLPGIESAKQMQENGEDVGSLNTKLLQKVEELTLYLIQLKQENQKLENHVNRLEKKSNPKS